MCYRGLLDFKMVIHWQQESRFHCSESSFSKFVRWIPPPGEIAAQLQRCIQRQQKGLPKVHATQNSNDRGEITHNSPKVGKLATLWIKVRRCIQPGSFMKRIITLWKAYIFRFASYIPSSVGYAFNGPANASKCRENRECKTSQYSPSWQVTISSKGGMITKRRTWHIR